MACGQTQQASLQPIKDSDGRGGGAGEREPPAYVDAVGDRHGQGGRDDEGGGGGHASGCGHLAVHHQLDAHTGPLLVRGGVVECALEAALHVLPPLPKRGVGVEKVVRVCGDGGYPMGKTKTCSENSCSWRRAALEEGGRKGRSTIQS
jgi:hypothetical protein